MVDHFGYSASFLSLGAAAAVAFLVFLGFMPETRDPHPPERRSAAALEGAPGE
jgi:predicted MFS family arabinose efflux permease